MRIAVCDDEVFETDRISALLEKYVMTTGQDIRYDIYHDGNDLLKAEKYDLYLLDYIMPAVNGVDTAKMLKEKYSGSVSICFLTSYENAAIEVINNKINAESFLTKPAEEEKLFPIIDRLYTSSYFHRLVLKTDKVSKAVYPQDIIYLEAMGRKTVIHFSDHAEEFSHTISEFEEQYLPSDSFCKVHRSYIVNLMHVESFDRKNVYMTNGDTVPLTHLKEFKVIFAKYNFNKFTN